MDEVEEIRERLRFVRTRTGTIKDAFLTPNWNDVEILLSRLEAAEKRVKELELEITNYWSPNIVRGNEAESALEVEVEKNKMLREAIEKYLKLSLHTNILSPLRADLEDAIYSTEGKGKGGNNGQNNHLI